MQNLRSVLFILNRYAVMGLERLVDIFSSLFVPHGPVDLHDLYGVMKTIEQAFTARQLNVLVTQVIVNEFETIYPLQLGKGVTQYDVNDTLPLIVESLQVEQWQVRPIQLPHPGCTHCIAVMF